MRTHLPVRALLSLGVAFAGITLLAPPASAGGAISWISGVGDDANPCTRTAPCKTWGGTIAKTNDGGFIGVLDPGNFGPANITKSLTIDGSGVVVTSQVSAGADAFTVNVPVGGHVVLRNFGINASTAAGACDGGTGVAVLGAGAVRLDGLTINGFQSAVSAAAGDVTMQDVRISDNCQYGVHAAPAAGSTARVSMDGVKISGSGTGVSFGPGAEGWLTRSSITFNATGIGAGGGAVHSVCDNVVAGNGVNGVFSDDLCGSVPTSTPVLFCTVPKVLKKTEAQAVAALKAASCTAGRVVKRNSAKKNKGKVIAQAVPAGILVKAGTAIKLVVGK
jgi:PASTA domain/Right handed beta helix region